MNLYELNEQWQEIQDELAESGGELTPELEARIDLDEVNWRIKAINYCRVISNLDGEAEKFKAKSRELWRAGKAAENGANRFRARILEAMEYRNITKARLEQDGDIFKLRIVPNSQPTVLDPPEGEKIPEMFLIPQDPKIDKTKILI